MLRQSGVSTLRGSFGRACCATEVTIVRSSQWEDSAKGLRLWLPVGCYCIVIFALSSMEKPPEALTSFPDKPAHLILYAGLGMLTARALKSRSSVGDRLILVYCTLFCLLYGMSDEFHQWFVPGRNAEVLDVAADCAGGFLGAALFIKAAEHWPGRFHSRTNSRAD